MRTTLARALAWRLGRHFLLDGARAADQVVGRLGAVPAWSGDPDLAIRTRLVTSTPGEVDRALEAGGLLKTYAFRGATHLMTPADAGTYLALRAASRMWERPSWVEYYGITPEQWPELRAIVRSAVAGGPATRDDLAAAVTAHPPFGHLAAAFDDRSDTFLKPFAWQGDLCFGPTVDGRVTYRSPGDVPGWCGIPALDDAGPAAVRAYVNTYGPTTAQHLRYWLGQGLGAGGRHIDRWLADLDDELVEMKVDGAPMIHAVRHLPALADGPETTAVTLLPGHDQWVLGPGTADERIVPPHRRPAVSRGANLVLCAGVVSGTWRSASGSLTITWFAEAGRVPRAELESEAAALAALLGPEADLRIETG